MKRILIVDDEKIIRDGAAKIISGCEPDAEITVCGSAKEALDAAKDINFDIAFCDIEMPGMSGIQLAKKIKKISPDVNIIFCTAYPQYTGEAMELHASGYITKPLTKDKVKKELGDLRYSVEDESEPGLRVKAFGNFEVYYNDEPLKFKYSKTKELFAYLVDRNCAVVTSGEIQSALWEDDKDRTSYLMQLRKDLRDTLAAVGEEDALVAMRGGIGLIASKVKCDFFEYLEGTPAGINAYHGEYMQQYSWAEYTHADLEMRIE